MIQHIIMKSVPVSQDWNLLASVQVEISPRRRRLQQRDQRALRMQSHRALVGFCYNVGESDASGLSIQAKQYPGLPCAHERRRAVHQAVAGAMNVAF